MNEFFFFVTQKCLNIFFYYRILFCTFNRFFWLQNKCGNQFFVKDESTSSKELITTRLLSALITFHAGKISQVSGTSIVLVHNEVSSRNTNKTCETRVTLSKQKYSRRRIYQYNEF